MYEMAGWKMLRNGAPDFLAIDYDEETDTFREVRGVEVKSPSDSLTYEQRVWRRVLEHLGVQFDVRIIE